MSISDKLLQEAIEAISRIDGLAVGENVLVEDVFLLAHAFFEEEDFKSAVASTCGAAFLAEGRDGESEMRVRNRVDQGKRVLCCNTSKETNSRVEVKGFGHRGIPTISMRA
ncbi:hypothetical protein [Gordonibacter urolithinfaciens]|uniref:hypothetical protein n=1 Tax=Gordonibacter urolithinfaciens TaxID=1335613 RepID=UPI003AAFA533